MKVLLSLAISALTAQAALAMNTTRFPSLNVKDLHGEEVSMEKKR